jgi:hypothetical protein
MVERAEPRPLHVAYHQANYELFKRLANRLGRKLDSFAALATINDPFFAETNVRKAEAEWVAALWQRHGFGSGTHIRRVHYRLISQEDPILMADGQPYQNNTNCWRALCQAVRDARYLDLISVDVIEDHRNPDPIIKIADEMGSGHISVTPGIMGTISMAGVNGLSFQPPSIYFAEPTVEQRYQMEIWCEKSTMNDILLPLHERYGVTIVTGMGELSLTACTKLIRRAEEHQKSVRILYVSDFDPKGRTMPVSVARKIEFYANRSSSILDIQVLPVVLTEEQCEQYRLPRTPIKDTDRGKNGFEDKFGEGATELDALEALYPGVLRDILIGEIEKYYDSDLKSEVDDVNDRIRDEMREITGEVHARHAEALAALNQERDRMFAEIERMQDALTEQARPLFDTIARELREEIPDVDNYDWPEPREGDEHSDPLFDSTREYLEQLDRYREFHKKSVDDIWDKRKMR